MADMLRVIEQYGAQIKQTEFKIQDAQQARQTVEEQVAAELSKKEAATAEVQALSSSKAGLVADRTRMEGEMQELREHNEGLKQDVAAVIAQQEALNVEDRQSKEAFIQRCMELEAAIKQTLTAC